MQEKSPETIEKYLLLTPYGVTTNQSTRAMMRTWRTLKQRGMQRNKEFGLFTKPSILQ
jgi:hypothetical protein